MRLCDMCLRVFRCGTIVVPKGDMSAGPHGYFTAHSVLQHLPLYKHSANFPHPPTSMLLYPSVVLCCSLCSLYGLCKTTSLRQLLYDCLGVAPRTCEIRAFNDGFCRITNNISSSALRTTIFGPYWILTMTRCLAYSWPHLPVCAC
jgi:hypothetical protein